MNVFYKFIVMFMCLLSIYIPVNAAFEYNGSKTFMRFNYPVKEETGNLKSIDGVIDVSFIGKVLTIKINDNKVLQRIFPTFKYGMLTITSFYDNVAQKNFYKILLYLQNTNDRDNLYLSLVGFDKNKTRLIDYINLYDFKDPFGATEAGYADIEINPLNSNQLNLFLNDFKSNQDYRYYLEWNPKKQKFDLVTEGYVARDRIYHH
ncbi:hypothetical protein [Veillonella criceti]|uniref:Uncharacterized protein n=1 Tax=Veillonella criceti TaxID=103891 RepID=A0A380NJY3_9FIRM|nr:hypothetical protein [Veillonella criceti]SUP42799.1 Uncharacterised protein [Veillonella criceti]